MRRHVLRAAVLSSAITIGAVAAAPAQTPTGPCGTLGQPAVNYTHVCAQISPSYTSTSCSTARSTTGTKTHRPQCAPGVVEFRPRRIP